MPQTLTQLFNGIIPLPTLFQQIYTLITELPSVWFQSIYITNPRATFDNKKFGGNYFSLVDDPIRPSQHEGLI